MLQQHTHEPNCFPLKQVLNKCVKLCEQPKYSYNYVKLTNTTSHQLIILHDYSTLIVEPAGSRHWRRSYKLKNFILTAETEIDHVHQYTIILRLKFQRHLAEHTL